MSLFDEFKAFLSRGNVVELAVGVVIGAAFGKIVTALVDGLILPLIGLVTGGFDLAGLKTVVVAADPARGTAEIALAWGLALSATVQFVLVAAVLFAIVKAYNRLRAPAPPPQAAEAPPQPDATALLAEIRDLLRDRPA